MVEITLDYPIIFDDRKLEKITLRRPKGKDIKSLPLGNLTMTDLMLLACKLSGEMLPVFDEIDASDWMKVNGVIESFLLSGPKDGLKS